MLHLRDVALLGLLYATAFVYPLTPFAACPVATHAHVPCPGCGSTRAILALAHGDIVAALHHNAAAPFLVLFAAIFGVRSLQLVAKGGFAAVGRDRFSLTVTKAIAVVWGLQIVLYALRFAGLFGGPEALQ